MCKTFNTIGSLTTLKSHLQKNNIHDFKSIGEVIDFQNKYQNLRQQLISHHKSLVEQERSLLKIEIGSLDSTIVAIKTELGLRLKDEIDLLKHQPSKSINETKSDIYRRIIDGFRQWNWKRKIRSKENTIDIKVQEATSYLVDECRRKRNRFQSIESNIDEAATESAHYVLLELDRKKSIIDGLNSFIYGALGEQKVVRTLESLSDEYYLINDFTVFLSTPVYNKRENDFIKSIQIDHILVGPAGIFLIETKNWSEKSLESLSLRSPVEQIKRSSFILFKLLNGQVTKSEVRLKKHHWGDRKLSVKNLIVMTNTKPKDEFQYVKVLTVGDLLGYINYFKPSFLNTEVEAIANFLIDINGKSFPVAGRNRGIFK